MSRKRTAVIALFIATLGTVFLWSRPGSATDSLMKTLKKCGTASGSITCMQRPIRETLGHVDGTAVMAAIEKDFPADSCHYIGHVVGQQSYLKYRSVDAAISQCSNACESACEHGIIGESFAQELGMNDSSFDLLHLHADDVEKIGKRLCVTAQPCHGVGHILFQSFGSFKPALAMCDKIGTPVTRNFCYTGVFMEYADILTSRSIRALPTITFPDIRTLNSFCTGDFTLQQSRTCFLYFPRIVIMALGSGKFAGMEKAIEICRSYSGTARSACFTGIGSYNAYSVAANDPDASKICLGFERRADKAACNLGEISFAIESSPANVFGYCARMPDDSLRKSCYQGVFARATQRGLSVSETAARSCEGDTLCIDASRDFNPDPWAGIRDSFGN